MRIVTQNVSRASLRSLKGGTVSIRNGLVLLVAFKEGDDEELVARMAAKVLSLRVFPDAFGRTDLSLDAVDGELLSVPQFTLYASVKGSRRPSFTKAMAPEKAARLFALFNEQLTAAGVVLKTGVFGADMSVELVNEGPFTLILDSMELFGR